MRKIAMAAALGALAAGWAFGAGPVKLWEKTVEASKTFTPIAGGATLADLDADGFEEIIIAPTEGKCHVWRCNGGPYAGFPKEVHRPGIFFYTAPAVGDIDGDGDAEVVAGARGVSRDGALYAWRHDGTPVAGFPIDGIYISGTVALWDLDGDGADEIIAGERHWPTGTMHVFTGKGRECTGWPNELYGAPFGESAVGDIDGDKRAEILRSSKTEAGRYALFAWNDDGTPVPGFPVEYKEPNTYLSNSAPPWPMLITTAG